MRTWQHIALIVGSFVAALFCAGQALTFLWLSAFPERANQLEALEQKFWVYVILSVTFVIVAIALLVHQKRRRKS